MPEQENPALNRAFLSLGSNISAEQNLCDAIRFLEEHGTVSAISSVWESPAHGNAEAPNFLNCAVLLETQLNAIELKEDVLMVIEDVMGRVREEDKNASRKIDLDLILFNEEVFELKGKPVPCAQLIEYAFVAIPVAELDPEYVHPETKTALKNIAGSFDTGALKMKKREDVKLKAEE